MTLMQGEPTATRQLTLNFSEGFVVPEQLSVPRNVTRTIVFPKHVDIPNFGRFQRHINLLFAPLGISVEFRLTRQKRLEMKWIFPPETQGGSLSEQRKNIASYRTAGELSSEEMKAFESVVFTLAGMH